jgi:hypothetical protein
MRAVIAAIGTVRKSGQVAHVSEDQVGKWRDGKARPPFHAMIALARAAEVSVQWLATGEGPRESPSALLRAGLPPSELLRVPRVRLALAPGAPPRLVPVGTHGTVTAAEARQAGNGDPEALMLADLPDGLPPAIPAHAELLLDASQAEPRPEGGLYVFSEGGQVFVRWLQRDPAGLLVGDPGHEKATRLLPAPVAVLARVVRITETRIFR